MREREREREKEKEGGVIGGKKRKRVSERETG